MRKQKRQTKKSKQIVSHRLHLRITRVFYVLLIAFISATAILVFNPDVSNAAGPDCYTIGCAVGGRLAPASLPPLGDGDVLNFGLSCGMVVTVVGPEGDNWGAYQWGMPLVEPPVGPPHDYWAESYVTNGYPYTHAGEYMLGYAIPNPNLTCPLPLLINIGTSLFKAGR